MATWINRSGETSCPEPGIRDEKSYLYWRIPARAGVFQLRERRRDEREIALLSLSRDIDSLFFCHATFFSLPHFYYSWTRRDSLCAYRPIQQIYLISLHYLLVTAPACFVRISLRSIIEVLREYMSCNSRNFARKLFQFESFTRGFYFHACLLLHKVTFYRQQHVIYFYCAR